METYKKILIIVLGVAVITGLGFLIFRTPKAIVEKIPPESPVVVSETPPINPPADTEAFGSPVVFNLNEEAVFTDGLKVVLTAISDSRCPKGVQCIWAGEVSVTFEVSGGRITYPGEVRLGTETIPFTTVENYSFSLKSADEKSAELVVEYKQP